MVRIRTIIQRLVDAFPKFVALAAFALFFEQRCGKTKPVIDACAEAYALGVIDTLIVFAPAGVHRNWITDELPKHCPDSCDVFGFLWNSNKAGTKKYQAELDKVLTHPGFTVIAINCEAAITDKVRDFLWILVKARRCACAVDESIIKTPGAKRTKVIQNVGKHCYLRFLLDGTPNAESPLELYAPFKYLDPNILGYTSYFPFRNRYAIVKKGFNSATGQTFDHVVGFQNIEELKAKIAPYSMRVTRRSAFPDMPEKIYAKKFYQLSPTQRRIYNELRDEYATELHTGDRVDARMVLTRYLRLQQVLSNVLPTSETAEPCGACAGEGCVVCDGIGAIVIESRGVVVDPSHHPRLDALAEILAANPKTPTLVWARFTKDIDDIMRLTAKMGLNFRRYDGAVGEDYRAETKVGFQRGEFDGVAGNPKAGGQGLDFSYAELQVPYTNQFALRLRLQFEDRTEHPLKRVATGIQDIIAEDTIDETLVDALRNKQSLSELITGDPKRVWL